jgi:hypothetical protein
MTKALDELRRDYLTEAELQKLRPGKAWSRRALQHWRRHGLGPAFVKVGNSILYPSEGVRRWLESHTIHPARERRR